MEMSREDKVHMAIVATQNWLISRKTATKWLAEDFGITDVESELKQIELECSRDAKE